MLGLGVGVGVEVGVGVGLTLALTLTLDKVLRTNAEFVTTTTEDRRNPFVTSIVVDGVEPTRTLTLAQTQTS